MSNPIDKNIHIKKIELFLFISFSIFFTVKLIASLSPSDHSDPLNYHLAMSKILLQDTFIDTFKYNTHFLLSGILDYLYIIPNFLYENKLYAQLMGQMMHFLLSLGLGAIVVFSKIRNITLAILGALVLLTLSRNQGNFLAAKNDGFLAAFGLITTIYILEGKKIKPLLAGLLLGLLPAIKMTGLFLTIPLSLYYVYRNYKSIPKILLCSATAFIVWTPILIRNYYFLENPFFPGLVKILPGNLHTQAREYYGALMGSSLSLNLLWPQIKACFFPKIIYYLLPFAAYINFKNNKKVNLYLLTVAFFFVTYITVNGGVLYARFYYSCHFILAYFLAVSALPYASKIKSWMVIILFIVIAADSKLDRNITHIKNGFYAYKKSNTTKDIVQEMIPFTRFWDHVDISYNNRKEYVLSDFYTQFYHAPKNIYLEQPEHNVESDFLYSCTKDDIPKLYRYSYAIISRNYDNPCYKLIKKYGIKKGSTFNRMTFYNIKDLKNK